MEQEEGREMGRRHFSYFAGKFLSFLLVIQVSTKFLCECSENQVLKISLVDMSNPFSQKKKV